MTDYDLKFRSVVLAGYQDQGNLGLGYLAASLIQEGFEVCLFDITRGYERLYDFIKEKDPIIIGFSLIFQYHLPEYARLIFRLRRQGILAHITMGGHFPSLCHEEVFDRMAGLDSIVRFEGEQTLVELARCLRQGVDWRGIQGLAYMDKGRMVTTALRPMINDLDRLPFPFRPFEPEAVLGKKSAPILATRGCRRNCVFCSIREFYGQAPGRSVRRRSPGNVVQEMVELVDQRGISIFLFQDDDFPLAGKSGKRWTADFIELLSRYRLSDRVIWKISCRVDEVEYHLFEKMKEVGLYLVYLGIESGTDEGLKTLNKQVRVKTILKALDTLKRLDLMISYGFMLFDPESSFDRVKKNIRFLRQIVGDGQSAVIFCKMLAYAGTPIEKSLRQAGRLRGSRSNPDYDFYDLALNRYARRINDELGHWVRGGDSVSHHLNMAWYETRIIRGLFPALEGMDNYIESLRSLTQTANEMVFTVLENYLSEYESGKKFEDPPDTKEAARQMNDRLLSCRNNFILRNQKILLLALERPLSGCN